MNKTFLAYWSGLTPEQKRALATKAGTSTCYLSQVAHGHRRAGVSLIARLESADLNISLLMMRPDLSEQNLNSYGQSCQITNTTD